MGIFGSVGRYLRTRGRLLYVEALGWGAAVPARKRRGDSAARARYIELMEPRILLTTLYGGESFSYTGSNGATITATLTGNVVAELIGAVQTGGLAGVSTQTVPATTNTGDTQGTLAFGDIEGTIESGPRSGTEIGNGSVLLGNANSTSSQISVPGLTYTTAGKQINLSQVAANASGLAYTFNAYDVDSNGNLIQVNGSTQWTLQLLLLNSTVSGALTTTSSLVTTTPDLSTLVPLNSSFASVPAAAFDPIDGQLYFDVHYQLPNSKAGTNGPSVIYSDELYAYNPSSGAVTDIGALNTNLNATGLPQTAIEAMTFVVNPAAPTTATLYFAQNTIPANFNPLQAGQTEPYAPSLLEYNIPSSGAVSVGTTSQPTTLKIFEGFGTNRVALGGTPANEIITGLAALPGSFEGGGPGYVFASVGTGASARIVRIDLSDGEGTNWGNTADIAESTTAAVDGESMVGLTYDPAAYDPFTQEFGAFVSIDSSTHHLDFMNHQLRISQGDVYAVYSNVSDINSAITFRGGSYLYTGNAGALNAFAVPANTGGAFLGFRGEIPNALNNGFITNVPFLTGELTGDIGILPGLVLDTTNPLDAITASPTNKLFAGLTVGYSLEQPYIQTGNLIDNLLATTSAFNRTSAIAIAADGTIAVMNSYDYSLSPDDEIGFVDPSTGMITGKSIPVTLAGGQPLFDVEGLAYGDPNLTGNQQLYAIYDLGNGAGPTLGTISISVSQTTAIFTPIGGMNLGPHAKVTAMAFTLGGTTVDETHESLYVAADPNILDNDNSESLYRVNVSNGHVFNAPGFGAGGIVVTDNGIGIIRQGTTGSTLEVASAMFNGSDELLVQDRLTGRLMDVSVTTAQAGNNLATVAGSLNPSLAGVAYDNDTGQYIGVDNMTGTTTFEGTGSTTDSAILITLKNLTNTSAEAVNLGTFLFDGTVTGKVFVSGSVDTFYAGWIVTGAGGTLTGGTTKNFEEWLVPESLDGSAASGDDDAEDESFFQYNFFAGGDIRNLLSLTDIGTDGAGQFSGTDILAMGRIGDVDAVGGTVEAVVHAENENFGPTVTDSTPLNGFGDPALNYTLNGDFETDTDLIELPEDANLVGSIFDDTPQPIDTFTTNFTFSVFDAGGVAFVVQNDSLYALGGGDTGYGYSGITNSAAIVLSVDSTTGDLDVGFWTDGQLVNQVDTGRVVGPDDDSEATITYDGSNIKVTLTDGESTSASTFVTSFAANLPNILGGHTAFVGFTSATGTETSFTEVEDFQFTGTAAGETGLAQQEIQHFLVDGDYSFATGFLENQTTSTGGDIIPFNNTTPEGAQYLGSIQNAIASQADVIHVQGELEDDMPTTADPDVNTVDYYAFGALAGQTMVVSVIPRVDESLTDGDTEPVDFAIFDPNGREIASDFAQFGGEQVQDRPIEFTTTIPGVYRIAVQTDGGNSNLSGGGDEDDVLYELTVTGVGTMSIGAIVANDQVNLGGSQWVLNSTSNTGSTVTNPSIQADSGDIGAIIAGRSGGTTSAFGIISQIETSGLDEESTAFGNVLPTGAAPAEDIKTSDGNVRAVIGGTIGNKETAADDIDDEPDFFVNGSVGLLQTAPGSIELYATFGYAATGDIQTIDAGGDLAGDYRTDKAIGVIRAARVVNDAFDSEFHVDVDRAGDDGVIDLIDVTGNWGSGADGGAAIVSGPGGDVRFMNVGGILYQDAFFGGGSPGSDGQIVHAPGPVTITDDSGAIITLTPTSTTTTTTNGTVSTTTTAVGQLTTRSYGVRGAGGQVLLNVDTPTSLTVSVTAGGSGRNAEIGTISDSAGGFPLTITNGIPTVNTNSTANAATGTGANASVSTVTAVNNITIQSTGNARVDVFNIVESGSTGTIDTLSNTTGGDIVNVTANDIGSIISYGNIGTMAETTGAELDPIAVFSNAYPFINQHFGLSVGNVGIIEARGSIGNILASGVVGTITPDATLGGSSAPSGVFAGITGPIVINGSSGGRSVTQVNIGDGIAPSGSGTMSLAGLYAANEIVNLTGNNADIRGAVVSENSIGTITLNNGSIIDTEIDVVSSYVMASKIFLGNASLPNGTQDIDNPVYNLKNITINGDGGIIGTLFLISNVNTITVGPSGFGILECDFIGTTVSTGSAGPSGSVYNAITAGGWGIQDCYINVTRLFSLTATGSGADSPITNYSLDVRLSESDAFDPFFGLVPNAATDLDVYLYGDGVINFGSPYGTETGVLGNDVVLGQENIGTVSAYDMDDDTINFSSGAGTITARNDINDIQVVTASVKKIVVTNNAYNFDLTAAGKIGLVTIGGNFEVGTDSNVTTLAEIIAKGASGDIGTMTVGGDFGGLVQADSTLSKLLIGTPGTNTTPSSGDFTGTIIVGGNHNPNAELGLLKLFGSILGGVIDVAGNIGTFDVAHDFSSLSQNMVVDGNVTNLIIGDDPVVNGSNFAGPLTITGNLSNATITGQMTGTLTVLGNVGKFTINSDPDTAGSPLFSGGLTVGGTLTSMTVQGPMTGNVLAGDILSLTSGGDVSGSIVGGRGIGAMTIAGSLLTGSEVASSLGNITKLTLTGGSIDGRIFANNGTVTSVTASGSLGLMASISGMDLGAITIPGAVSGSISSLGTITSLKVGTVTATGNIAGQAITGFSTVGDMLGTLDVGVATGAVGVNIGGNLGGTLTFSSPANVTVSGSMLPGSLVTDTANLTSVTVKGTLSGDVLVDHTLNTITAASVSGAAIVAGLGIGTLKVTGAVNNTLISTGLPRGDDGIYGTNDLNEQARMADATSISVGTMTDSVVAVGGNIGTFKATGAITGSDISTGLVLGGANIAAVLADSTPLADSTDIAAAMASPTLLHGNIASFTGTQLLSSNLTAGVSPGADGIFGTGDDNINSSITGGASVITKVKVVADVNSLVLAKTASGTVTAFTPYTFDSSSTSSIVQADPITGATAGQATPGSPVSYATPQGTITVTIVGPADSYVNLYDDDATTDRLDTLLISGGTSGKAVSVTVTTTSPSTYNLGRVLTTDGTQLAGFTFLNGTILGDAAGGPSLWIDSNMSSLTLGSLALTGDWHGEIGGNVGKLNIGEIGLGQLRIGGTVTAMSILGSTGNPLIQQLGTVSPPESITQMTIDPTTGTVYGTDGTSLISGDLNSGVVTSAPVATPLPGQALTLSSLGFDSSGTLFGVATLNNQNPIDPVGQISEHDHLIGMAVSAQGQIYAIERSSGSDTLVTLNTANGTETVVGVLRNSQAQTYTNNVVALAFDPEGDLLALVNDRDGNGALDTPANGYALAKIATSSSDGSSVRISNPNSAGTLPVLITGTVHGSMTSLAVDSAGNIYAVSDFGGSEFLYQLQIGGSGTSTTVTITSTNGIAIDNETTNTSIIGMGFDENNNLIALNANGTSSELIAINVASPVDSYRLDEPALLPVTFAGFAVAKSGSPFTTYAYTTNLTSGGELYQNPGTVATLGIIADSGPNVGQFLQLLPLAQNAAGTADVGAIQSMAIDSSGNIFALSDTGELAEYSSLDGSLIGGQPLGTIQDQNGDPLNITRIAFDASGDLIGLSATAHNLVSINTTPVTLNGTNAVVATTLTDIGTVDTSDLTSLAYSTQLGEFVSYSTSGGDFVAILGTSPNSLGGVIANGYNTITLPMQFGGRILATSIAGGNGINTLNISGAGIFTGGVYSYAPIGNVKLSGGEFNGAIVTHDSLGTVSSTNATFGEDGVISADGNLRSFTLSGGSFGGAILAGSAGTIAVNNTTTAESLISVINNASSISVSGQFNGELVAGSLGTLKIGGGMGKGSEVALFGNAANVNLGGGVANGALFWTTGGITGALTVGGTLSGTVATRLSVKSANLATVTDGLLAVGNDLSTLNVSGAVTDSVLASGVWVGSDGEYNTADDIIYGGSIGTAKINGVFTDSLVTAGVLPAENDSGLANNLPFNTLAYVGNPAAADAADVDSAEAGGILVSRINTITFAKRVVSTQTGSAFSSALVAADGIGKVSAKGDLQKLVRSRPVGAPQVVIAPNPQSQALAPQVLRVSADEIDIVFNQPIDSASINNSTIQAVDNISGNPITDLTFGYTTQIASDGSTQGVVKIFSQSGFGGSENVNVTLQGGISAPTIVNGTGLRSSLFDYDQDGTPDANGDPFGATLQSQTFTVGAAANDDFANAILIPSLPATVYGSNVNATVEAGEPVIEGNAGGASVWWKFVAPAGASDVEIQTEGTDFEFNLAVYTGDSLNDLTQVTGIAGVSGDLFAGFPVTPGVTYYIQFDGYNSGSGPATGDIQFTVQVEA